MAASSSAAALPDYRPQILTAPPHLRGQGRSSVHTENLDWYQQKLDELLRIEELTEEIPLDEFLQEGALADVSHHFFPQEENNYLEQRLLAHPDQLQIIIQDLRWHIAQVPIRQAELAAAEARYAHLSPEKIFQEYATFKLSDFEDYMAGQGSAGLRIEALLRIPQVVRWIQSHYHFMASGDYQDLKNDYARKSFTRNCESYLYLDACLVGAAARGQMDLVTRYLARWSENPPLRDEEVVDEVQEENEEGILDTHYEMVPIPLGEVLPEAVQRAAEAGHREMADFLANLGARAYGLQILYLIALQGYAAAGILQSSDFNRYPTKDRDYYRFLVAATTEAIQRGHFVDLELILRHPLPLSPDPDHPGKLVLPPAVSFQPKDVPTYNHWWWDKVPDAGDYHQIYYLTAIVAAQPEMADLLNGYQEGVRIPQRFFTTELPMPEMLNRGLVLAARMAQPHIIDYLIDSGATAAEAAMNAGLRASDVVDETELVKTLRKLLEYNSKFHYNLSAIYRSLIVESVDKWLTRFLTSFPDFKILVSFDPDPTFQAQQASKLHDYQARYPELEVELDPNYLIWLLTRSTGYAVECRNILELAANTTRNPAIANAIVVYLLKRWDSANLASFANILRWLDQRGQAVCPLSGQALQLEAEHLSRIALPEFVPDIPAVNPADLILTLVEVIAVTQFRNYYILPRVLLCLQDLASELTATETQLVLYRAILARELMTPSLKQKPSSNAGYQLLADSTPEELSIFLEVGNTVTHQGSLLNFFGELQQLAGIETDSRGRRFPPGALELVMAALAPYQSSVIPWVPGRLLPRSRYILMAGD